MDSAAPSSTAGVIAAGAFPRFEGLVTELGFERRDQPENGRFCLVESSESSFGLELRPPDEIDRPGIRATFPPDRNSPVSAKKSALIRAFGKKVDTIFDLTTGLGADAYRLASAGYVVRGWERHDAVYALVASAWAQFRAKEVRADYLESRLVFSRGDGARELRQAQGPSVAVYLDPMYPPPKRASALPKRNLQVLRRLLGEEPASDELEIAALAERAQSHLSRVVVKRPHHAPPLLAKPDHSIESKLVRFDVYLNPKRMEASAW